MISSYGRSTLAPVRPEPSKPPGRFLLRLAGALTQLIGASCLLLCTIALVLIQQHKAGGAIYVGAWAAGAMLALVFGGLMARGGMISVLACAVLDLGFGIFLLALDEAVLRGLVKVLPASDVAMIADLLTLGGTVMLVVGLLCIASIYQAIRYAHWLQSAAEAEASASAYDIPAGSTAKGWIPATAKISVWAMPASAPAERRSRRRMYFALAGLAIGFGAGIGVLVSATSKDKAAAKGSAAAREAGSGSDAASGSGDGAGSGSAGDLAAGSALIEGPVGEGGSAEDAVTTPREPVETMLSAQRAALAKGDIAAITAMLAPNAFGFGVDAADFAEGRDAVAAQLAEDLGSGETNVESKFELVGVEKNHAWIAAELDIGTKRYAITQLAAYVGDKWQIVAWHWAIPVANATAERHAILGTLPSPRAVANTSSAPAELDKLVRAAFGSRSAFVDARSERDDAFNFGSAPRERIVGGTSVKRVFGKLRAQFRIHDGVRLASGESWDPQQAGGPWIAVAALNVDFTSKTRAATDLTQTFRVLAVLLEEGDAWRIVLTQWSHGGPIR